MEKSSRLKSFSGLNQLKTDNSNNDTSPTTLQSLLSSSNTISSGYSGTSDACRNNSRSNQASGRHHSLVYTQHQEYASPSLSGSSSESDVAATVTVGQTAEPLSNVSSSSLDCTIATDVSLQSPRSLQDRSTYTKLNNQWGQNEAQHVRMDLSRNCDSRASSCSRANSSADLFATSSSVYDDKESGPRSCPSTFGDVDANRHKNLLTKRRSSRGGELIVSKLQPTYKSVNNMLTYLHELKISEASLRKQLLNTKRHTQEELNQSLSKLNELQRTMKEVERDRKRSLRKLDEKEQRIRELAAKLKKAEATQQRTKPCRRNVFSIDELPRIEEEADLHIETKARSIDQHTPLEDVKWLKPSSETPPSKTLASLTVEACLPPLQQNQPPEPPLHSNQTIQDESTQYAIASPRSPNHPPWDPWASGGATTMSTLPPVFTIGSAVLNAEVTSVTEPADSKIGHYELKSVLLSSRKGQGFHEDSRSVCSAQENEKQQQQENASMVAPLDQHEGLSATLSSGLVSRSDSLFPSPPHPFQQDFDFDPPTSQDIAHGKMPEKAMTMEFSLTSDAMRHVEAIRPIREKRGKQQEIKAAIHDSDLHVWNGLSDKQDVQIRAARTSTDNKDPSPTSVVEHITSLPLQLPVHASPRDPDTHLAASDRPTTFSSQSSPTLQAQPDEPAFAFRDTSKDVQSAPVSLEMLLVDFFTEVDNKRLKMAKVYGKRYAGREKWLFAELTKRYGAAKVTALKTRFENGSGGNASTVNNRGSGTSDHHATHSSDASTHPKAGRQVHSRHPQFLQPPIPASNADSMSAMSFPAVPHQEKEESRSQTQQVAEEGDRSSTRGERMSADSASSPQKRQSGGHMLSLSSSPPLFSNLQETGKEDSATAVGTGDSTFTSKPVLMTRHGEPPGQFNQLPPRPQTGMDNSNAASLGLRQRHQSSGHSQTHTDAARPDAKRPAVTLEGLLKELYKKHQPDKLKNVSIVAKQYAGKERELVGLLKGKYGALSVKRLEENLDVLERANRTSMGHKGVGKKRGCFIRTISLLFWLSLLLYFSFGAVFVSFVVLDAWGCHAFDSEEQELEAADDCLPLKKELDTFTYERIPAYVSQSHPDACFCSEWKARESAVFGTFSCASFVNLVRLVPFTPESFGVPWVATVKEQVPSQEVYDSYTKPVLDLSLDISLFMDKKSEPLFGDGQALSAFSAEMEMEAARVMSDVDEDLASLTSTFADADVEVMNVESDDGTARKVFETEAEAENVEEEQTSAEVLEVEPSAELSSDFEYVAEESELPNPIDVNERELMSVGEEIAGSSLNEGGELETDTEELDHLPAPEFEAQETETTFDEEVGFLSVENDVNMVTDEEFVLAKSVVELSFNSRGVVADAIVSEEGTACSSDGGYGVTEEEGINDHDETVSHAEMEEPMSNNVDDENVLEEKFEEAGDGVVIPDEIKIASKLELEEYAVGVPNEDTVVPEWTEDLSNQDFDLQEGVEEAAGTSTDIEAAGEESGLPSEAEVEKEEEAANEMDEVASVESPPFIEIERRHSVSEVDLADELDERSVAIEAAVGLDDEDTESAEHGQDANEHVEDVGTATQSTSDSEDVTPADDALKSDECAYVWMDEANAAADFATDGLIECVANDGIDEDEEKEISFMQNLQNLDEMLRLAERAAAAMMEAS
ncbi:unnamed protein product [Peronospora belbahrii]|uniref:Uncharacterized protein n=1 Tax=Peronospora belbahrii TaxID=622444 RepID=A0AAU9L8U4_9STRA|nr:unnamed protein product [Peronospora belbahrii]